MRAWLALAPCAAALHHVRLPGTPHGSHFSPAAYAAANATLAQMNLSQKISMVHGWGAPTNPGYAGYVPQTDEIVALSLEDGAQGVGNGLVDVTAFPSAMTMAAAWDVDLACAYGSAIGAEQYAKGTNVALAPGLNLARVPWSGRVYEYLGEDPHLAASLSFAYVACMQQNNITATVKHFMGNSQEQNRGGMSSNIPVRAARELYYASFQGAVDAGVGAVMLGTNAVNDTKNYNNSVVIGYLKDTMGFDGWTMTDWDGPTSWDNALAGLDQGMPGTGGPAGCPFWEPLQAAVEAGNVSEARLDDMVRRMLVPMYALGLQANPPSPDRNRSSVAGTPAHAALARAVAEQSMVLLKNDPPAGAGSSVPLLPLDPAALSSILIVGDRDTVVEPPPNSGCVQTPYIVSPFSGVLRYLAAHFNQSTRPPSCSLYPDTDFFQNGVPCHTLASQDACCANCSATPGCMAWTFLPGPQCPDDPLPGPSVGQCFIKPDADGFTSHPGLVSGVCATLPADVSYLDGTNTTLLAAAAAAADVVVIVVAVTSHEGEDRTNLSLPWAHDAAVEAAVAANPRTIVVARCPGACVMPWLASVPAVLAQFVGGQEAGNALASVLFGAVNPSGKLPVSFPASMNDTWLGDPVNPAQSPGIVGPSGWADAAYSEDLLMGYRWYDAQGTDPLFPFGHGLSYTSFSYGPGTVAPAANGSWTLRLNISNSGGVAGAEVVQLYVSFPPAALEPPKLLRGFSKVPLAPGEEQEVAFTLTPQDLRVWDTYADDWTVVSGTYVALVGSSSRDIRSSAPFEVPQSGARSVSISNVPV